MRRLRAIALFAIALVIFAAFRVPANAAETTALASKLQSLYLTAYDEAINRHASLRKDGTTYVSTGDIDAEWLRDASAVVEPYIDLSRTDQHIEQTLRGVLAREARYILIDAYANAFTSDYKVSEEKFEVDSLLYPIWFAAKYWHGTKDRRPFTNQVNVAFERTLQVLRDEQHHNSRSHYRNSQLAYNGQGSRVRYTGMVWTGFRPSDDPCRYHYNVPVNMFAVVALRGLSDIERTVYHNRKDADNAWGLSVQIQRAIEQYATVYIPPFGRIYAYEVDGLGHFNVMDDANPPSLLSIPYFGYLSSNDSEYQATRRFALSPRNPYYFVGKYARGIGSPHTPRGYVWPLALVVQALTSSDPSEVEQVMRYIGAADIGDHRLHESFNADWPEAFTRDDFAWPNAMYAELIQRRGGTAAALVDAAGSNRH